MLYRSLPAVGPASSTTSLASWRSILLVHPAAELFPPMSPTELRDLGEDIVKNGLRSPIVLWREDPKSPICLLDGRNRLDAIEIATGKPVMVSAPNLRAGDFFAADKVIEIDGRSVEPYAYVTSVNLHRRNLTIEQKHEVIVKLLKAMPDKSDRQIAKMAKVSPTTVGAERHEMEAAGTCPVLDTRLDTKGREQPAKKARRNMTRAMNLRRMKLGDEVIDKLAGTSLGSALEIDELIKLNRGAPEGELTDIVKRLVDAVAGKGVSAVAESACDNAGGDKYHDMNGDEAADHDAGACDADCSAGVSRQDREDDTSAANPAQSAASDDVGADGKSETERRLARADELEREARCWEIQRVGYESKIEELKAKLDETSAVRHQRRLFRQVLEAVQKADASGIPAKEKRALHDGIIVDLTEFVRSAKRDGLSLNRFDIYCRPEVH